MPVRSKLYRSIASQLSPSGRRGRLAVFSYHQVLEKRDPLRFGEPDARGFEDDIDLIGSTFNVLPLNEAVRSLVEGKLPARAASITFDDGYENNYWIAEPILMRKGLPATFFVACDAVDTGIMWNDLVIETVARCRSNLTFESLEDVLALPVNFAANSKAIATILSELKYLPVTERWQRAVRFYQSNCGDKLPTLMMTREMVCDLSRRGFDIGGHTMRHPILKELSPEAARTEIVDCRDWIFRVTGKAPGNFAYPNGRPDRDFDEHHMALVKSAGFKSAVTTEWAIASHRSDPFKIPRIGPWWRLGSSFSSGLVRAYAKSLF